MAHSNAEQAAHAALNMEEAKSWRQSKQRVWLQPQMTYDSFLKNLVTMEKRKNGKSLAFFSPPKEKFMGCIYKPLDIFPI